jgi:superfamily II DNA or RNA helicase
MFKKFNTPKKPTSFWTPSDAGNFSTLTSEGYVIPKQYLNKQQIKFLKDECTITPNVMETYGMPLKKFKIYKETPLHLIIPRYIGLTYLNNPSSCSIPDGDIINVNFKGSLRPMQVDAVTSFTDKFCKSPLIHYGIGGGCFDLFCAAGKTVMALHLISCIQRKTLVIVHKEFLMTQWKERIEEFLPNARIGIIQGDTIDIENKDIVLGMVQSLSMKEYDSNIFSSFGLLIVDEVHRICSATFSMALLKVCPKITIGLSATIERKDGTTPVLFAFLGPVVYKGDRTTQNTATIVIKRFIHNDNDFNTILMTKQGKINHSSMVAKLCSFDPRVEFVANILRECIQNEDSHILVLSQHKMLLEKLYDDCGFDSIGYYIGGMKDTERKDSETKKIILATYNMAAEGLDIKTLNTLVLASPMTDIEQSIGRILREKHNSAMVFDVVDTHYNFNNMFRKRHKFYKNRNYNVIDLHKTKIKEEESQEIIGCQINF